jgi:hypothetical protein
MDWHQLLRLRRIMDEAEQHRREVIGRLFAMLTAHLEDGAETAMRGQNLASIEHRELALSLLNISQDITAISEALLLLLEPAAA